MFWVTRFSSSFLAVVLLSGSLGAQGFGKVKRHVQLRRKLPPIVQLTGSFEVKVAARDKANEQVAQKLGDILETEILQYNNALIPDKAKPDNTITCTVVSFTLPPAQTVNKTIGYDKQGRPMNGQFKEVHGSIVVSYQVKTRAGRVLDSDNVVAKFAGEYDAAGNKTGGSVAEALKKPWHAVHKGEKKEEPKDFDEVLQMLIGQAGYEIAAHLVKTDEGVDVMLARGKLDDYNKLAEAGLWPRMLEPLETMQPLPKAEDDAYRLYNLGVVYEALAYKAEDAKSAKKFLDQSAINYGKAIDANPGEKYFLQPQNRIETALAHYKKLETQASAPASSPAPTSPVADAPRAISAPPGGALTNDQVIAMQAAGMDAENLIAAIKQAPAVNFDFSVEGQIKLVKSGVNGKVLTTMRERANAAAQAPKKAPSPANPAPKK